MTTRELIEALQALPGAAIEAMVDVGDDDDSWVIEAVRYERGYVTIEINRGFYVGSPGRGEPDEED